MDVRDVEEAEANDLLRRFAVAVFEKQRVSAALMLMTPERRSEWAHDWVVGELEAGSDLMSWDELEALELSLASVDAGHRLWADFAGDTLRCWHDLWRDLPAALDGRGQVRVGRHLTPEEWAALPGQVTLTFNAPPRTGPPIFQVWVDPGESGLLIADVIAV